MEILPFSKRKEILKWIQEVVIQSWEEVLGCQIDIRSNLSNVLKNILKTINITEKWKWDIVTNLDFKMNELLISGLLRRFKYNIETEECIKNNSWIKTNIIDNWSRYKFIIDPIDGTTNLTIWLPFSTAITLVDENENPLIWFVYDPINIEQYHSIWDWKSYRNYSEIHVSKKWIGEMLIIISDWSSDPQKKVTLVNAVIKNTRYYRIYGSAQLDLCRIAKWEWEWYLKTKAPNWDVVAWSFIVENAWGKYEIASNKDIIVSNWKQDVHNRLKYIMSLVYDENDIV